MTISGVPAHPLIVHATVVAVPVMALLAVVYVVRPRVQDRLRWPLLVGGILLAALVWLTASTGNDLKEAVNAGGPVADLIHKHQTWAGRLEDSTWVFAALAVVTAFFDQRETWLKGLLHALLVVAAVVMLVLVVLTGHAGAEAAWYGIH